MHDIQMNVRTIMAIGFLPVIEVRVVFYTLKPILQNETPQIRRFLRYFEAQWIQ